MTTGEIIFAVMVAIQGVLFLIALGFFVALIISKNLDKSEKLASTALIIWGTSQIFPIVGVFFGFFL